jgi:trimethylamine--corrinoid protein Co-methyltransferase
MAVRGMRLDGWRHPALEADAVAAIHEATLRVLERTGVAVGSPSLRRALGREGAIVDPANDRVRFPAALVEGALGAAPRDYTLAARDPENDLPLDGRRGFLSVDGSAAEILDPRSGERRSSTAADLELVTRLGDAIPEIGFLWQGTEAGDTPAAVRSLHELRIQLSLSTKHVQLMTATTPFAAERAVAMAAAVAGGPAALRERPILSSFQCSLSPLAYDGDALEAALVYARAGVPAGFVVMSIACATAPATAVGVIVQSNAEILAGITILETLVPGAPTFYGACPTVMDLRSGRAACGGPEDALFQVALAQLGHGYGLPTSIGTFAPGAKASDWQAGVEGTLSGIASLLGGADMLSGAGLLNAAAVFSLEQLVLDAEIFGMLCHLAEPISITADDLADSLIDAVGPRGNYLAERHTVANMRRLWMPRLFDRSSWEEWSAAGRPDAAFRAGERVRALLETHEPTPLPSGVGDELDRIVSEASAIAAAAG